MVEYKIITSPSLSDAELQINSLAKKDWLVVATSISIQNELIITLQREYEDPFKR